MPPARASAAMSHGRNDSRSLGASVAGAGSGAAAAETMVCEGTETAGVCGGPAIAGVGWKVAGAEAVADCAGAARVVAARWVRCRCGAFATDAASSVRAVGGGVVVAGAGAGEAVCVLVPGRLKPWSSRGPIASVAGVLVAGVLVVAGAVVSWASAIDGESVSPPTINIILKRKPALISSRSVLGRRSVAAQTVHARANLSIQAQLR